MVPDLVIHIPINLEFFLAEVRYFRTFCQVLELSLVQFFGEFLEPVQIAEEKEPFAQVA